jgi:hypothetical protein
MYHNHGKAINKHVEAERRTSFAAQYKAPLVLSGGVCKLKSTTVEMSGARPRLSGDLNLELEWICTRKPDAAA